MLRVRTIKITSLFILIMVGFATGLSGQDTYYTQFSNIPIYYNPAYTGIYTGARVRFSSRLQQSSLTSRYNGYQLSADLGDRNLPGSGGFGIMLNTDDEGISFIQNFNLGASFAARVPFSRYMIGQVGIQATWLQKNVSWDKFVLSERFTEKYGNLFDSGSVLHGTTVLHNADFSIGGLVQFVNARGCFSGTFGIAADHLFQPNESLMETVKSPLARKYTAHADLAFSFRCPTGLNPREDDAL